MTPLCTNGLSDELFLEMLGRMETVFQNFSAHGSSWVLQHVSELYIKIGKVLPIRGSSFIPLPAKIANFADNFAMPRNLNMIPQFERLNNVQVNVFQYQNGDLIPIIVSKLECSDHFNMSLLVF